MSSSVPYVAPWQSGFERYSTQIYAPPAGSFTSVQMTIPDGQWWRIVYIAANVQAEATAGNRTVQLSIIRPGFNGTVLHVLAKTVQVASSTVDYLFTPGASDSANTTVAAHGYAVAGIPDVLWPAGNKVIVQVNDAAPLDAFFPPTVYAVEIYTEVREGVFAPALAPTPLVS